MNKDNVAEKEEGWNDELKEMIGDVRMGVRDDVCIYELFRNLLISHRLSLKEEILGKLPKEVEIEHPDFDCDCCDPRNGSFNEALSIVREVITSVLKEK